MGTFEHFKTETYFDLLKRLVGVTALAWGWDSLKGDPGGGSAPGGLGPGWVLARSVDQGLAGWLLGPGRPLVLAAAVVPAVL